jgi:hypothetical protein
LIRWEGYESAEDTWEPEVRKKCRQCRDPKEGLGEADEVQRFEQSNCNAPELVAKYWKKIPTHKQPRKMQEARKKLSKVKSPKKKAKRDTSNASETEEEEADEVANALDGPGATPTRKRRKGASSSDEVDEKEEAEKVAAQIKKDQQLLQKWNKVSNWEGEVKNVITMERSDDETLRVKLRL